MSERVDVDGRRVCLDGRTLGYARSSQHAHAMAALYRCGRWAGLERYTASADPGEAALAERLRDRIIHQQEQRR